MNKRRTSIYVMTVVLEDELVMERLTWMQSIVGRNVAGALATPDGIVFAFRSENDVAADQMATYLAVDRPFKLFTGIGIHRREVAAA